MRILIATPQYHPELGGLTTLWSSLAPALAKRGHVVTVVTQQPRSSSAPSEEVIGGVIVHRFRERLGGERFGYAPGLRRWVRRHREEFDVVNLVSFHAPLALALYRVVKVPTVFSPTYHGGGHTPLAKFLHLFYQPLSRDLFRSVDKIQCLSPSEANALETSYPRTTSRLTIIAPGFGHGGESVAEPKDLEHPVVLVTGRLETYKRVDLVIEAMQFVQSSCRLVICGTGPQESALRDFVRHLKLDDQVQVLGYVTNAELARWQHCATVAISASSDESFGLSLAEAASAGARTLASDLVAHRDVAELLGVPIAFFPPSIRSSDLAAMIDDAVTKGRQNAQPSAPRDWDDAAAEFEALYTGLVNEARS